MPLQRSKTRATLFPAPELVRTGHSGAALGWAAVAFLGLILLIVAVVVAWSVSLVEGAVFAVLGALALLIFAVGSMVHARWAVDRWNAAADKPNRPAMSDSVKRGPRDEGEQG